MTHPYRLALSSAASPTCLDPPARACEPPPRRRPRVELLLAGCALIAGAVGVVTFHAVGHGGHVEIGPAALAHVRGRNTSARRSPRVTPPPRATKLPMLSGEHDPKKLVERARQLQTLGLDVSVVEMEVSKPFARSDFPNELWPTTSLPLYDSNGFMRGFEIHGLPQASPFRMAIAEGDQILGVDGYDFADGTLSRVDLVPIRTRGSVVLELVRNDHHVVLSIHWPVR